MYFVNFISSDGLKIDIWPKEKVDRYLTGCKNIQRGKHCIYAKIGAQTVIFIED